MTKTILLNQAKVQDLAHRRRKNMSSENITEKRVVTASNFEELAKFILDNRPITVYQFWIDTYADKPDEHKMSYSKIIPNHGCYPSDVS